MIRHIELEMPSAYWHGVYRTIKGPHGGVIPRRMSEAQETWFRERPPEKAHWLARATTATGCRIQIAGAVRRLRFSACHISSCRPFFGYELRNPEGFRKAFTNMEPLEDFAFEQELPEGTSGVTLLFPYQSDVEVLRCDVETESEISPVFATGHKVLFFGDSITQGWEAVNPAECYACRVVDAWKADYCNLSVGGTIMDSENIAFAELHEWDRALLAFGVNDVAWNVSVEKFAEEAEQSIAILTSRPGSRLAVLSPIWWPVAVEEGNLDHLQANRQILCDLCSRFPNAKFVDGKQLVPADRKYFADNVHPNSEGMAQMAQNLLKCLSDFLTP